MARVYGTEFHDDLHWLFDGVTNGDDIIFGLGGGDWIEGLGGNDIIMGGEGADTIKGGDGSDTATYMDSPKGVHVNLLTGEGHGGTAEGDYLDSIENLTGSFYDDILIGDDHDNVLSGSWGDDVLMGGAGADTMNGRGGVDTASYMDSPEEVFVNLMTGDVGWGTAKGDHLNSIENVTGSFYGR